MRPRDPSLFSTRPLRARLSSSIRLASLCALVVSAAHICAEPIAVKNSQGASRGFLVIRSESGEFLASGEETQLVRGSLITSRLTFHFRDGSVDDDTTTFSQRGVFKLVRDHHVQRGPFFPKPIDVTVDAVTGIATSRSIDKDGKPKIETEHFDMPPDIANGFIGTLLLNVAPNAPSFNFTFLAPSGKGRLVKVVVSPAGEASFRAANVTRKLSVFRLHVDIGGVAGVVAPIIGKAPEDTMVWVLEGEAPALIRQIGQLYVGGPSVSIELNGTTFPK